MPILTMDEVAARYQLTRRKLFKIIRKFNLPVFRYADDIRFDEVAIAALETALRGHPSAPAQPKIKVVASMPAPVPAESAAPPRSTKSSTRRVEELLRQARRRRA